MRRGQALAFVGAAVAVGLAAGVLWTRRGPEADASAPAGRPESVAAIAGSVTLYFPGDDGRLHAETRALDTDTEAGELARRVVANLIGGPEGEGLFAPLPATTEITSSFLGADGTLYLDLSSAEHALPPVAGSQRELLAAYSLVNSVCGNVPRIRGVALLWNGEQRVTFGGNLDTTRPLAPDRRLVSAAS
ncbi:MAG: GerMN domain-containing protein [Acidobacteriota bacterium]|nr:GerMN domain-containing protein [Acidobacteriota bacterium]MDH3525281.1 GerMN domain-containing protein [Acidobacteriota bacterium]